MKSGRWERIVRTLERALALISYLAFDGDMGRTGDIMIVVKGRIRWGGGGGLVEVVDFVAICSGRS